jgi:hypothetical protein
VFGIRQVELRQVQVVGQGHLKGVLHGGGTWVEAIGFQMADRLGGLGAGPVDAAVRLERNEFQGRSRLQARLMAVSPSAPSPAPEA